MKSVRHATAARYDRYCPHEERVSCPCIDSVRRPVPKFPWRRAWAYAAVLCYNGPKPKQSALSPSRGLYGLRNLLPEPEDQSNPATEPGAYRRCRTCRGRSRCRLPSCKRPAQASSHRSPANFDSTREPLLYSRRHSYRLLTLRPGEKPLNKCLKRGNSSSTESNPLCFPPAITTPIHRGTPCAHTRLSCFSLGLTNAARNKSGASHSPIMTGTLPALILGSLIASES